MFAASDTDAANNRSVAHPVVKVINTDSKHVKNVHVTFHIYGPDGSLATPVATSATGTIAAGTTFEFDATDAGVQVPTPQLWSIQSPSLYTLVATVFINKNAVDSLNATFGLRSATFSADSGFALNDNHVVLRGFSNHNDMAGVGVAVPQRLNLFRAQMLRGVGANIWRMSHNPGDPATFDLLDRLGIMSWDENRDYGRFQVGDMKDMVLRDRNHPAIIIWSFCNEVECTEHGESEGAAFRAATLEADHTRPISGNLLHDSSGSMLDHFDVVGISHVSTIPAPWTPTPASWYDPRYSFKWFHKNHPTIPLVSSESTSCNTQRGENVVNTAAGVFDDVFNADCLSKHFCPPNTTKALDQNISGYMHSPGLCTQSWTMAYEDDGTIFPFIGGHLGIWYYFHLFCFSFLSFPFSSSSFSSSSSLVLPSNLLFKQNSTLFFLLLKLTCCVRLVIVEGRCLITLANLRPETVKTRAIKTTTLIATQTGHKSAAIMARLIWRGLPSRQRRGTDHGG